MQLVLGDLTQTPSGVIPEYIHRHAEVAPTRTALIEGARSMDYATLDAQMNRVAAALQQKGLQPGDAIAICATMSLEYAVVFLGALRIGVVVAPLAPSTTPAGLARMVRDADAKLWFVDAEVAQRCATEIALPCITLDGSNAGESYETWLSNAPAMPQAVSVEMAWPFNIIYSSGTTGEPKGIVQSHGMRWTHVRRCQLFDYDETSVALVSTPLYSNTTLVVFFPTLTLGGTVVLMPKFDAGHFLQLAEQHHVTHAMLVPVQYQRIMARPDFAHYDLSHFRMKFSTSAPFNATLMAEVLTHWPGGLVEFYGMTEGGGTCILEAHKFPDKLHTVGKPAAGHDIRLIDEEGHEVSAGELGEVVGHSMGMMTSYHRQPEKTREAEWFDTTGKRFIRTGDVGCFDAEGFLTLFDRKKDMIISGGFNVYPSDLEAVLCKHPVVHEAAVIGVPSEQWGETPVACVVLRHQQEITPADLLTWVNQQVGKTQRLTAVHFLEELPRSTIGKVLKRSLREQWLAQ